MSIERDLLKIQSQIADKYGDQSAMFVSDMPQSSYVSSGSLALDFAVGTGGFPTNRALEIAGDEGCGKTTLGIFAMSKFLDAFPEKGALILDVEHKLTESWIKKLIGRERAQRVIVAWPDTVEEATDIYTKACKTEKFSYVLFDSIGGAPTQRVTGKSAESGNIGGNALGVTRFAQFAGIYSNKYNVCTVGVNQSREDMSGYNRHTTPGGRAWKHACILRIQLKRGSDKYYAKVDGEDLQVGYSIVAKIVKNQMAPPYRIAWWTFFNVETEKYGFGIDRLGEISRLAVTVGVIEQRGAWYYHEGLPDGKIKSQARLSDYLKDNDDFADLVSKQVIETVKEKGLASVAPAGAEGALTDDESQGKALEKIFLDEDLFGDSGEENQEGPDV